MILNILQYNYITIGMSCALFVLIYSNNILKAKTKKLFLLFICFLVILNISETIAYRQSLNAIYSPFEHFVLGLGYAIRPATLLLLSAIFSKEKRITYFLTIPIIINAVIALTSYYTHLMFWYDAAGVFYRGPLGFLPHILSLVYAILIAFLSIKKYRWNDFSETLLIFFLLLFCGIASELETLLSMRFILSGAMITTCTLYYIYLLTQIYKRDYLTALLNRHMFFQDAIKWRNHKLTVISIDLNCLKDINDSHGHQEGDKALKTLSGILASLAKNNFRAYRLGGDEFNVLGKEKSIWETEKFIAEVKSQLKPTGYMASFGFARYVPGDNFDDICKEADQNMYQDKSQYKHRTYLRGRGR